MSQSTQKDAELLIQLFQLLFSRPEMMDAFNFVMELENTNYEDFAKSHPIGSQGWNHFIYLGSFYELVGVLVKYVTINEDMVFDSLYLAWDKLGPIVKGFQKAMGSPHWLENYEYLAKKKAEWRKNR